MTGMTMVELLAKMDLGTNNFGKDMKNGPALVDNQVFLTGIVLVVFSLTGVSGATRVVSSSPVP